MERRAKTRLIIVTAIVLVLLAVLLYRSSVGSLAYFKTVTELTADQSLVGKTVRVGGQVVKGSLVKKQDGITFTLSDEKKTLKVTYAGTIPSAFGEGQQVIAEGTYGGGDTFEAKSLITKCPSKYQTKTIKTE